MLGSLIAAPFVRLPAESEKAIEFVGGVDHAVSLDTSHTVTLAVSPYAQGNYTIGMVDGSTIKILPGGSATIRARTDGWGLVERLE